MSFKIDLLYYMNRFTLSSYFISQEASLFLFSKIIGVYLQNIPRDAFLFCLRIRIVYHGENFLITGISSRIEQDLGSTENTMSQSNCNNLYS